MNGFIEVHFEKEPVLLNVDAIEQVQGSIIFLRTPAAHFEYNSPHVTCRESYDEIKLLIQEATNG